MFMLFIRFHTLQLYYVLYLSRRYKIMIWIFRRIIFAKRISANNLTYVCIHVFIRLIVLNGFYVHVFIILECTCTNDVCVCPIPVLRFPCHASM